MLIPSLDENERQNWNTEMAFLPNSHLSNHAIPGPIDFLPMFPIGHQIKVIGELHRLRNFL